VENRPQRPKTAKRRAGGTLKDGERRRLAAESRARRGEQPRRPVAWCDGGLRGNRAAAAFVLMSANGRVLAEEVRMVSPAAIEDVECAAVAAALERAAELRLDELEVRIDSQVVVDWLTAARRPQRSRRSLRLVTAQLGKLGHVSFRWVPRDENAHVDQLVWAALSG
jgi:ribonuclease H / adenosylcobalamin/alpha-ribazole phosphatase